MSVRRQSVLGFKARLSAPEPFSSTDLLYQAAAKEGLLVTLDRALRQSAIDLFASLPPEPERLLFLDFETSTIDHGVVGSGYIWEQVRQAGLSPKNVVINISESDAKDNDALKKFIDNYRGRGFLIALSDVGSGHSNLSRVALARPDILEIGSPLVGDLHRDPIKQEIFKALMTLAHKIGALVLASDTRREEEALLALEMGVDMVEGPLWEPFTSDMAALNERISRTAAAFKSYTVDKKKAQSARERTEDLMVGKLVKDLSALTTDRFESRLAEMVRENPGVECLFILNDKGRQVTDAVWNSSRPVRENVLFRPARRGADHSMKDYYFLLTDDFVTRFRSEPYISQASGSLCVTLSGSFRDASNENHVLCVDLPIS